MDLVERWVAFGIEAFVGEKSGAALRGCEIRVCCNSQSIVSKTIPMGRAPFVFFQERKPPKK